MPSKEDLRKENINAQMEQIKSEEYSASDYNEFVQEINSLEKLEEGEDLPFRISRFCQEYVICYDEAKAAQKAGYSIWNASAAGIRLLNNPKVGKEIQRLQKQITQKLQITQERVLEEYAKIAYMNIKDYVNDDGSLKSIGEIDRDAAAAIIGINIGVKKVKDSEGNEKLETYIKDLKSADKKAALDMLAKYLGMFVNDVDRKIPVDLKEFIKMLPKETQEAIKIGFAKRLNKK